ncbi:MAG TPA: methyltransferase domain-containing protein [Chlamydiales bacterium]|nr:methyltransferase domain-containing protein [Chlamydiales bacterium]
MRSLVKYWLLLSVLLGMQLPAQNMIRAAIDIGSGGPKLRVAEVDVVSSKIVRTILVQSYPVIFQNCLSEGSSKMLTTEVMAKGILAIKDAITLANSYESEGIVIIGSSVFRNAKNASSFAEQIFQETNLPVHILDQDLEGRLAFYAALASLNIPAENLLVWDIGGGSMQLTGLDPAGSLFIDRSKIGSGQFRDYIIESIQSLDLQKYKSPNPISHEQAILAELYAMELSRKIEPYFRNKPEVIGVGSVIGKGIASYFPGRQTFTIEELSTVAHSLIEKTDAELGGGDYACIEASNVLLLLGLMKGLNIHEIRFLDVNNAEGAMVYKSFWEISTFGQEEYANVEKVFANNTGHIDHIAGLVSEQISGKNKSLLDIGAGPATITERLSPLFSFTAVVEPNKAFESLYQGKQFEFHMGKFQDVQFERNFDFILCSHVLYHVPFGEWSFFLKKMNSLLNPAGKALILMVSPQGKWHKLRNEINPYYLNSDRVEQVLKELKILYELIPVQSRFTVPDYQDFKSVVRLFTLDDCFLPKEYDALSKDARDAVEKKIEEYISSCKLADGAYEFFDEDVYLLIHKD